MVARNRLVISGTLGSTASEIWSVGFNYGPGTSNLFETSAELTEWAGVVATFLDGFTDTGGPLEELSSSASMTTVDTYFYPGPGNAAAAGQAAISGGKPGTGTADLPFQTSRCVTLRTENPGRSYRGRFYWPAIGASITTTGVSPVGAAAAQSYADLVAGTQQGPIGTDALELCVYSPTLDVLTAVSSVSIGSILDVQRRRTNGLAETYTSVPFS